MTGNWPRCQDLTISGHDLGRAALSKAEEGSDSLGFGGSLWKVLGVSLQIPNMCFFSHLSLLVQLSIFLLILVCIF
jgi:hypothetical protein